MNNVVNLRVIEICKLLTPVELKSQFPLPEDSYAHITQWRKDISNILHKKDKRFLAIVGPCSVHDGRSALDYAYRLNELRKKVEDKIGRPLRAGVN